MEDGREIGMKFKGIPALIVIALMVGFGFYQHKERDRTLDTEAVEKIKTWIVARYIGQQLPRLKELAKDPTSTEEVKKITRQLDRDNVKIVDITARGRGDDVVVRVEIEVDGQDPPDGVRVRYYRMQHSMLAGWHYDREVSKWSYTLTF